MALAAPKAPPAPLPARQPLPRAVLDPNKPMLKLGLDVHLQFIMAVGQKGIDWSFEVGLLDGR